MAPIRNTITNGNHGHEAEASTRLIAAEQQSSSVLPKDKENDEENDQDYFVSFLLGFLIFFLGLHLFLVYQIDVLFFIYFSYRIMAANVVLVSMWMAVKRMICISDLHAYKEGTFIQTQIIVCLYLFFNVFVFFRSSYCTEILHIISRINVFNTIYRIRVLMISWPMP